MKKIRLTAVRAVAAAVFVFAFMLNIHTSLEGETILFGQVLVGQTGGSSGSGGSGGSGGTGSSGSEASKRLKVVNCSCPNGKTGKTAKCRTDGDKELCTATQQGLSGCYSTSAFSPGKLLCEGI